MGGNESWTGRQLAQLDQWQEEEVRAGAVPQNASSLGVRTSLLVLPVVPLTFGHLKFKKKKALGRYARMQCEDIKCVMMRSGCAHGRDFEQA